MVTRANLVIAQRSSAFGSKIQFYDRLRPRTADQHIPSRRRLEWLRVVEHRPADQGAFAGMADSRPARPLYRNVAGLRKFQQALVRRTPRHIKAAPREGDHRAGTGGPRRWVRQPRRSL